MCGISGFIDFNNQSTQNTLHAMTDAMTHRGPDGAGYEFFQNQTHQVGLGHRRLSIIDLTDTGKQPMRFEHWWMTFNGEVYNYQDIKKELELLGHQFIGNSDTEVMLHAYVQWGVQCVHRFIGMFAFVIYDTKKQELLCVRDRAGVKPFFYYWNDGLFLFASELKAFHQHPYFKKEINMDAVAAFMQYGNVPTPHCIFKNCYKLKPAHVLTFNIHHSTFSISKYWDVYDAYNKPKLGLTFNEAMVETEKLLQSAFNYRMVSDVPVGVFLSGGYDSACVTSLLQKNNSNKLKTFTIGVADIGLNEAPFAKEIAKHLGTEHHEYECTEKDALELINDLPYYYDEPFADSSAIPTTLVCKMAKKQVTVALSADGGDEIFAGYNRYDYMMKHGKLLNALPSIVNKGVASIMDLVAADHIPVLKNKYNFHNRYEKLKGLLKDPLPKNVMLSLSQQYNDKQLKELVSKKYESLETAYLSDSLIKSSYSSLAYMMAIDYQTYLVDDVLQKVDRASMTVSLEGREPFLDHRIIEFVAQLPDHFKYHKGIKKHILKEITHQYIPKTMMDRPKTGFAIPIEKWLATDLKEQVLYYLNRQTIESEGIFNADQVDKIVADFFKGKKEYATKIWYLLMFEMWYRQWM